MSGQNGISQRLAGRVWRGAGLGLVCGGAGWAVRGVNWRTVYETRVFAGAWC